MYNLSPLTFNYYNVVTGGGGGDILVPLSNWTLIYPFLSHPSPPFPPPSISVPPSLLLANTSPNKPGKTLKTI